MWQTFRSLLVRCAAAAAMATVAAGMPAQAQSLTVLVDSSVSAAMTVVARDFKAGRKGDSVSLRTGSSGRLLELIAEGTQADVLAGTDLQTLELGEQHHELLPGDRTVFATNVLVLIVPASLDLPVQRLADLAKPEVARIAMGRPTNVPAGRHAREAINAQRLWSALQRKVVIVEDTGEVLTLVAGADAEAGFAYKTDVAEAAGQVRVVQTLPTPTPIRHLASVVARSPNPALARAFVAHLRSKTAGVVFGRFGFGMP
jgi:molybdate transport system substrate-binding protein